MDISKVNNKNNTMTSLSLLEHILSVNLVSLVLISKNLVVCMFCRIAAPNIMQNSKKCTRNGNLFSKVADLDLKLYYKNGSAADVLLWPLKYFSEQHFNGTLPRDGFWRNEKI